MRGNSPSLSVLARASAAAWAGLSCGFTVAMTLRFTSPQAAMVSSIARCTADSAGLRLLLMMPWYWIVSRVVSRMVPLARSRAIWSSLSHCSGSSRPPGMRSRAMKEYAFSMRVRPRSGRKSRSSCM